MKYEKPKVLISEEVVKDTNVETNPAWVAAAITAGGMVVAAAVAKRC